MKAQKKKTQDCFTDISENEHAAKVKKESQNTIISEKAKKKTSRESKGNTNRG